MPIIKRQGARLVSMTGNPQSSLAVEADAHLDAAVAQEACPLNLAPTASTTAALALGDALAVALLDSRGFGVEDFARSHPGGSLGRRLLTHVRDVMHRGPDLPEVSPATSLHDAILEITRGGIGMTAVVDPQRRVIGIVTDGDLRRAFARSLDLRTLSAADIMGRSPRSIAPDRLAVEAVTLMEEHRVNQLPVVDAAGILVGALNMHDLFRAKVI
ncbi:MAG: Arabinose 5-phosphate isomerase KdsD [Candidatus Accumulibacter sp. SK-11]|nr:MAG: Arabinose 5-phosphate isomerase KdsD [Candidatus Accumulibacter sp. SK-11]